MKVNKLRKILLASVLTGIVVGLFGTGFMLLWQNLHHLLWDHLTNPMWRIPISAGAGLLIGLWFSFSFYPGSLSSLIQMFHRNGRVPLAENIPVIPANMLGLIAGQSAGPEGALSAFGGSIGTWFSEKLQLAQAGKILTLAGMGAGFGTILGAPVGGALLWLELPHKRGMEYYEALTPTLIASVVGYIVMATLGGFEVFPHWNFSTQEPLQVSYLFGALFTATAAVICAFIYTRIYHTIGNLGDRVKVPIVVRTTCAGILIGLAGMLVPLSYFYGGKHMSAILTESLPLTMMLVLLLVKMVACAVTIHGYWQGGLIIPQMFIGALIGQICGQLIPGLPVDIAMLCGIGAFNAAVTGTPLASALIAISLTQSPQLAPVFLATITASVASPTIGFLQTAGPRKESPEFHINEPIGRELELHAQ